MYPFAKPLAIVVATPWRSLAADERFPDEKSVTACWAPLEIDWATCGPISWALCPATTSFTILASECEVEGSVVVVVGGTVVVVVGTVVVVTTLGFDVNAKAMPMPAATTRTTAATITHVLRVRFGSDAVEREGSGASRGGVIDVAPSCPPRSRPASPTTVVTSLAGVARTHGVRNAGAASIVDTSSALRRSSGTGASMPARRSFQGTGSPSGTVTGPAKRRASTSLGVPEYTRSPVRHSSRMMPREKTSALGPTA